MLLGFDGQYSHYLKMKNLGRFDKRALRKGLGFVQFASWYYIRGKALIYKRFISAYFTIFTLIMPPYLEL